MYSESNVSFKKNGLLIPSIMLSSVHKADFRFFNFF